MLGSSVLLPVLGMLAGGALGMFINPVNGWLWGGVIGFGVGCLILALVAAAFELLKRYASR